MDRMIRIGNDAPYSIHTPPEVCEEIRLRLHWRVGVLIPGNLGTEHLVGQKAARDNKKFCQNEDGMG